MTFDPEHILPPGARIKVIGIGGGGGNAVNTMIKSNIEGVEFITANTDIQALRFAMSPHKIQVGKELTKGLGAGADPDIGRDAALEDRHEIQEMISGADMVFVTAGMGGGTGTGGAAVVAQIARESGALTVGVVTKPFTFEGKRRKKHAEIGIQRLRENVDTLIVIPNERLLQVATPDLSMIDAFKLADNVLVNAVRGISDIINVPGTVNVDFADVKSIMSSMGQALMGIGISEGDKRAMEAARQAISSPLLEDVDIEGATGLLINITAGSNISLMEVNEACSIVQEAAHEDANIIFGAVIDENMGEAIRVTVIATGFPGDLEEEMEEEDFRANDGRRSKLIHSGTLSKRPIMSNPMGTLSKMTQKPLTTPINPVRREVTKSRANPLFTQYFMNTDSPVVKPKISEARRVNEDVKNSSDAAEELTRMTLDGLTENLTPNNVVESIPTVEEVNDNFINQTPPAREEISETNIEDIFEVPESSVATYPTTEIGKPAFQPEPFSAPKNTEKPKYIDSLLMGATSEDKVVEEAIVKEAPLDSIFDENSNADDIANDIDHKIDQALEVASRVESSEETDDNLDVPAFLRQGMKDIPID